MTILDNLKSFTVSQYIIAGLAITYLVLTIIALAAVYGESPNVELARKVFTGLLTMSAFGAGYAFGGYKSGSDKINMISGAGALVFAILAIGASNAINSVEKDAIDSTKKWLMGMGVMSLAAIMAALFQHGPALSAMASNYLPSY